MNLMDELTELLVRRGAWRATAERLAEKVADSWHAKTERDRTDKKCLELFGTESYRDIAERLGCDESTTYKKYHRAKLSTKTQIT